MNENQSQGKGQIHINAWLEHFDFQYFPFDMLEAGDDI